MSSLGPTLWGSVSEPTQDYRVNDPRKSASNICTIPQKDQSQLRLLVVVNKAQIYLVNTRCGTHHTPTHITQSIKLEASHMGFRIAPASDGWPRLAKHKQLSQVYQITYQAPSRSEENHKDLSLLRPLLSSPFLYHFDTLSDVKCPRGMIEENFNSN